MGRQASKSTRVLAKFKIRKIGKNIKENIWNAVVRVKLAKSQNSKANKYLKMHLKYATTFRFAKHFSEHKSFEKTSASQRKKMKESESFESDRPFPVFEWVWEKHENQNLSF